MTATLLSLPPELYDLSPVSLNSIRSNFILIEWFYLVRMEETMSNSLSRPCSAIYSTTFTSRDIFPVTPSNQNKNGRMQKSATLELYIFRDIYHFQ